MCFITEEQYFLTGNRKLPAVFCGFLLSMYTRAEEIHFQPLLQAWAERCIFLPLSLMNNAVSGSLSDIDTAKPNPARG